MFKGEQVYLLRVDAQTIVRCQDVESFPQGSYEFLAQTAKELVRAVALRQALGEPVEQSHLETPNS
jgi:hypothetical protein